MFRHPKIGSFFQAQPRIGNAYLNDGFLQRVLKRMLPEDLFADVNSDLTRFGSRVVTEIERHGDRVEANQPYLKQFDPWGNRIDELVTDDSWTKLKHIAAEEGLVSIAYDNKYKEFGRLYQHAKIFLYSPSSGLWSCPLAMTDGAAKVLTDLKIPEFRPTLQRLTTTDPKLFWSSGQWMTERRGGSDVGAGTETIAVPVADNRYKLYGYKWFTSAIDADVTLTLARIQNEKKEIIPGSTGLSMFYLETRDQETSKLNNIQVMKLKNKLGTRQLPTGELLLDGANATLVSAPGRGVATISGMLSVTRVHNASASVSGMRRITHLLRDYSSRRECFGTKINTMSLHLNTVGEMEVMTRAGTVFVMELARLFGISEHVPSAERDHGVFRILTPIGKLFLGKICMQVISEGVEGFGGNGYIEDTGIPRALRDAQVTPIWEGTTNVLSMDVLRAIAKSQGQVLTQLHQYVSEKLDSSSEGCKLKDLLDDIQDIVLGGQVNPTIAREFAFSLAEVTAGALLLEHAKSPVANKSDHLAAKLWVARLVPLSFKLTKLVQHNEPLSELVYDSYTEVV